MQKQPAADGGGVDRADAQAARRAIARSSAATRRRSPARTCSMSGRSVLLQLGLLRLVQSSSSLCGDGGDAVASAARLLARARTRAAPRRRRRSGSRAPSMRSTMRGKSVATAGGEPSLRGRSTRAARQTARRRFPAAGAGSARRWPGSACRARSGPGRRRARPARRTPSIFRAAMATWSCTSGDGSRASLTTASRTPGATVPCVAGRADGPGAERRVGVGEELLVKRRVERPRRRSATTARAAAPCAATRLVEHELLAASQRMRCRRLRRSPSRSVSSRCAVSRK